MLVTRGAQHNVLLAKQLDRLQCLLYLGLVISHARFVKQLLPADDLVKIRHQPDRCLILQATKKAFRLVFA